MHPHQSRPGDTSHGTKPAYDSVMKSSSILVAALFSLPVLASEPVPTQPPTRGLLGRSATPVAGPRSLAEVAKQKPTAKGHVSQADASGTYQDRSPMASAPAAAPAKSGGGEAIIVSAPAPAGVTHGGVIVGVSIEQQREQANANAAAAQAPKK